MRAEKSGRMRVGKVREVVEAMQGGCFKHGDIQKSFGHY